MRGGRGTGRAKEGNGREGDADKLIEDGVKDKEEERRERTSMADGVGDLPFFFAARACMGMGAQSAAHLQTEAAHEQWRLRSNISLFFSFLSELLRDDITWVLPTRLRAIDFFRPLLYTR
jgi:hypothetical protein